MFDNLHQQNLADWILNRIDDLPAGDRAMLITRLKVFEGTPWRPDIFAAAVAQVGGFRVEDAAVLIDGNPVEVIRRVLETYLRTIRAGRTLTLKKAHQWLIDQDLTQRNSKPYTLIALKTAVARGHLFALLEESAPQPYFLTTEEDLRAWLGDPGLHQPGPKKSKDNAS